MRVYATTDDGERFLARIECDEADCEARIKPNPDIANSGWEKGGLYETLGGGVIVEEDACPDHTSILDRFRYA